MALADRITSLETSLDELYARLATLGVTYTGIKSYSLDGESYTVEVAEIIKAITDLEALLQKLKQRPNSRRFIRVVQW